MLRVCHVTPTYFAADSVLGGGERHAEELARAMSHRAEVKLVSFGRQELRERLSPTYERVILKSWTRNILTPFSPALFGELAGMDVIHCHQYFSLPTFLACLTGHLRRSRVFVSDLGGGAWTPGFHIDQSRWIYAHLPISQYAALDLPGRNRRHFVTYCGVDLDFYPPRGELKHDGSVVFLGRILPHKGIHFLIEGMPAGRLLHVIGPVVDTPYLERLHRAAAGKRIEFHHGLTDSEVVGFLSRAMALVHPTPVDQNGSAGANELLGLAPIEAMACGCPVIASRAASLPETVVDDETGFLVPPNDPAAITTALLAMSADPERWAAMAVAARRRVEERFTLEQVVDRCLAAYELAQKP
ncbi:MAG TPA: glycosyltransferase family 4 protein [Thermoanaerobaculia bacterium]|nr:glycosyltransferase family 4 protein [Thermoanaerobaculia bacterium]